MSSLLEGTHPGEFLFSEAPGTLSRENVTVTVPAATTYPAGLVLGKITATGKYVAYNNGASDGSEVAAGVLYAELKNAGAAPADVKGVAVERLAEVRLAGLNWNGQDATAQTAGVADLLTKNIKCR
ncbi:MAG TPA: head decoration protein [Thermoanaerobaculia bacterium]|nr:head decoration protein [Thermoanaerobaculia bacterium]